jgi:hypothetical protein
MIWLILLGTSILSGFMPWTWSLPLLYIPILDPRSMIVGKRTLWRVRSSRRSSCYLRGFGLWSSRAWLGLGSSLATCVAKFSPWTRGSTMASSILELRTHLGWS